MNASNIICAQFNFCVRKNTNIYFCLGISCLFINIASIVQKHCLFTLLHTLNMPYLWKWFSSKQYCLLCKQTSSWNPLLGHFFSYYSPLGSVLVLIWSGLNIKLQKITANKFCDMTFCLRCLHFKPLNIYRHIPLFSLPKIKHRKENILNSGCTTKLGRKLFPLLACLEYCLFCLEEPWWCV